MKQIIMSRIALDSNILIYNQNCETLYSEDMENGQLVENSLKIVNPFI